MAKCYDKTSKIFLPYAKLGRSKQTEIASLMRTAIDALLDELKNGKANVDLMDVIMFKSGVKKKMLQEKTHLNPAL